MALFEKETTLNIAIFLLFIYSKRARKSRFNHWRIKNDLWKFNSVSQKTTGDEAYQWL